jgi:hypothetical protein
MRCISTEPTIPRQPTNPTRIFISTSSNRRVPRHQVGIDEHAVAQSIVAGRSLDLEAELAITAIPMVPAWRRRGDLDAGCNPQLPTTSPSTSATSRKSSLLISAIRFSHIDADGNGNCNVPAYARDAANVAAIAEPSRTSARRTMIACVPLTSAGA